MGPSSTSLTFFSAAAEISFRSCLRQSHTANSPSGVVPSGDKVSNRLKGSSEAAARSSNAASIVLSVGWYRPEQHMSQTYPHRNMRSATALTASWGSLSSHCSYGRMSNHSGSSSTLRINFPTALFLTRSMEMTGQCGGAITRSGATTLGQPTRCGCAACARLPFPMLALMMGSRVDQPNPLNLGLAKRSRNPSYQDIRTFRTLLRRLAFAGGSGSRLHRPGAFR